MELRWAWDNIEISSNITTWWFAIDEDVGRGGRGKGVVEVEVSDGSGGCEGLLVMVVVVVMDC